MNTPLRCFLAGGLAAALVLTGCTSTSSTPRGAASPGAEAVPRESARSASTTRADQNANYLTICSFNIQWLGQSPKRDNAALADLLAQYDIVVIQELIAKPATSGSDPGARQRAADFFREMGRRGFAFHLSGSDTGPNGPLGTSTSKTEWWVTFFRPEKIEPAAGLPQGFVSMPLAKNPDYDRVPYALPLRTTDRRFDFVLLSVHLNPDKARTRRAHELKALGSWIAKESARQNEKDFIVLGDTNIQGQTELSAVIPAGMVSLNVECVGTNVSPKSPRPYDQVFFSPTYTTEIDRGYGFHVINLIEAMRPTWTGTDPYPGNPYQPNVFRFYYSDHNPVAFRFHIPDRDDD